MNHKTTLKADRSPLLTGPIKLVRAGAHYLHDLRMRVPTRYIIHVVLLIFAALVAYRNATGTSLQAAFKSSDRLTRFIGAGHQELIVEGIDTLPRSQNTEDGSSILSAGLELPALAVATQDMESLALISRDEEVAITDQDALAKPSIAQTKKGTRPRRDVITYTVKPGDTLSTIAEKFGLKLRSIVWNNNYSATSIIKDGDNVLIMPFDGIRHRVKKGETLQQIVSKYKASLSKTLSVNNLSNENAIKKGQFLLIPDGVQPPPPPKPKPAVVKLAGNYGYSGSSAYGPRSSASGSTASTGTMRWPAPCRTITQYFHFGHTGVDIACSYGGAIVAADGGVVVRSAWDPGGYGYAVVIRHDNGLYTRYAHLKSGGLLVGAGQRVSKGQTIGLEGSTGRSTGPHVHFEVFTSGNLYGGFRNPLNYI